MRAASYPIPPNPCPSPNQRAPSTSSGPWSSQASSSTREASGLSWPSALRGSRGLSPRAANARASAGPRAPNRPSLVEMPYRAPDRGDRIVEAAERLAVGAEQPVQGGRRAVGIAPRCPALAGTVAGSRVLVERAAVCPTRDQSMRRGDVQPDGELMLAGHPLVPLCV